MGGMKTKYLKDEISLSYGKSLPAVNREEGNYNVFGSNGVIGHHNYALFKGPGIVVGRKGTVGSVYFSDDDFCAIDTTYVVKLNTENDDIKYWFYYLKTLGLEKMNSHSAVPGLNRDAVYSKEITVFEDVEERNRVSALLSCLDDKIELNNRMNKLLEEMAQAIFKSWFVDFEPFQNGKFVDSELGRIPEGWRVGTIDEFSLEMMNGGTPSRKKEHYWNSPDVPWIKTGEIKDDIITCCEEYISYQGLQESSAKLLPLNTVLLAMYGATAGRVGLLRIAASTNQACCAMICKNLTQSLYLFLFLLTNQSYIKSLANGAAQQNLSKDVISKLKIIIPSDSVIESSEMDVIFDLREINIRENILLQSLRDTLLPKLMSGEIRVPIQEE